MRLGRFLLYGALGTCIVLAFVSVTYRVSALEANGVDWVNASLQFESVGVHNWKDGDQNTVTANIPSVSATAKVNDGTWALPNLTDRTYTVYNTAAGYFGREYALPLADTRWQAVDLGSYRLSAFYGSPNSSGLLMFVNSFDTYGSLPLSLRFVPDWRSMFGKITTNWQGNVTRQVADDFNFDSLPVLKRADGSVLSINARSGASLSKNGEWLYVNSDIGQLRAHVPDLRYQHVAPRLLTGKTVVASLSNSGRFVASGAADTGFVVYDLNTCMNSGTACSKKIS